MGLPKAQGEMARRYDWGLDGLEKDLDRFFEWSTKAAEGGDGQGQFRLGYAYSHGQGTAQDFAAALEWYKLAAEQGCAVSTNWVGNTYFHALGDVDQDHKAAFTWYLKGAEAGCKLAQYHVGKLCFYDGQGVRKIASKRASGSRNRMPGTKLR